jgi:hypothetical protein
VGCFKIQKRIQNSFENCFGNSEKKKKKEFLSPSSLSLSFGSLGLSLSPQAQLHSYGPH